MLKREMLIIVISMAVIVFWALPAYAQRIQPNPDSIPFAPAVNYGVGINPYSVFCADLDGDTDRDLAVANSYDDNISILKNNGNGTYQSRTNYGAGNCPHSVFCANLDGDTALDLAVANYHSDNVYILKNNGDGTFQTAVNYGAGDGPQSLFCADLDADSDLDLAVTNEYSDDVSILKNNGDGTFQTAVNYGAGSYPHSVFCADLDSDGDSDLAVANKNSGNVSILKNYGDGTFQTAVNYGTGLYPLSVYCADLDGDNYLDLAVAKWDSVSILKNNGDGSFQARINYGAGDGPWSVFCADLDNDNDLDLAVANYGSDNVSILKNNGDGTFQTAVNYGTGEEPLSVFCADLDGDTDFDLAAANHQSENVSILINLTTECISTNGGFFEMDTHPWGFDNMQSQLWPTGSGTFPSWSLYCQAFDVSPLFPSPSQILYYGLLVLAHGGEWAGSCYGMAYTCQLLKDGFHSLTDFDWTEETLPINVTDVSGNEDARDYINSHYLYQFGSAQLAFKLYKLLKYELFGPSQVITDLLNAFDASTSAAIGLWWAKPNYETPDPNDKVTVGHAVTPICVSLESQDPDIYEVWVYDNNKHEDQSRFLTINTTDDTWTYSNFGAFDEEKSIIVNIPTSWQIVPPIVPKVENDRAGSDLFSAFADSGLCLVSNGGTKGILIVSDFDSLGFWNGELTDGFEGGAPVFISSGVSGFEAPYAYLFPRDEIDVFLSADSAGDCNFFLVDSTFRARISLDGEEMGGSHSVNYDTSESGISIASNSESSSILGVGIIEVGGTHEIMFECNNYEVHHPETLTVAFSDFDSNDIRDVVMMNVGTEETVAIKAEFYDGQSSNFESQHVEIASNSVYHFFPEWDSLDVADMVVWIDQGGDGTIDDTIVVENEYGMIRGDANGDEVIDLGDVVYLINYLYRNGSAPDPLPAGDCNCDGIVDLGDVVYLINYLFRGGPAPGC